MLKGHQLGRDHCAADAISIPVVASGGLASIEDVSVDRGRGRTSCKAQSPAVALYDGRLDAVEALTLLRTARN